MKVKLFDSKSLPILSQSTATERQVAECFLFLLLVVSVVIYIFIPKQSNVSMPLFYICFILMLISNYIYFRAKKKKNYFDFDTIFILVYCLVGFSTTFVYNDELIFKAIFLGFPVEEEYINISNLLFLIGLQTYLLGSLKKISKDENYKKNTKTINTKILGIAVFILSIFFIVSGGISYYRSVYDKSLDFGGPGISKHILLLLVSTAIATISTEFYNKRICSNYKMNRFVLLSITILILLLLWAGNRTAASQLLLPIVCLYTLFFKNISFKKFCILFLLGIVSMWGIQNTRANVEDLSLASPILLISDLTIPARTTYIALEYVDTYGYTCGKSMFAGIIGTVPLLPSIVAEENEELLTASAELLTQYTYDVYKTPVEFQIGLGTTIVGDIYLAFGLIGIILLMYLLGYFINKYTTQALLLNYYSVIIIGGMLANAVFIVRASYTHPIRFVLWALIIACLNKSLLIRWKK